MRDCVAAGAVGVERVASSGVSVEVFLFGAAGDPLALPPVTTLENRR
jgi:hypothetical protein